jgi:hypothetical protein
MVVAERHPETRRPDPRHPVPYPKGGEIRIREVPPRRILEVKGTGRPDSDAFRAAVSALYTVAYGVHFALRARGIEARVGPLEGLWTFDRDPFATAWPASEADPTSPDLTPPDPDTWLWSLLIELPEPATDADVETAVAAGRRKHPSPQLEALRSVWLEEGEVVEAMHIGPYATEPETMARMKAAAVAADRTPIGPHHEIYLGDPRRSAPERLKTVLRQPLG